MSLFYNVLSKEESEELRQAIIADEEAKRQTDEKPQKLNRANRRKYVHNVTHPDKARRIFRDGVWQLLRPTKGFRRMTRMERIQEARQVALTLEKSEA